MVEYKVVGIHSDRLEEQLNRYAREGWRLEAVIPPIRDSQGPKVILAKEEDDE